ncbi:hypothetical protein Y032_0005g2267 [Ancylostoma ceylanicum]|uniref:Chondroitin proteoglycan 4 domain-containing protein n=1 Tax=Ancylostoma ceylanicum TaxID=53326 RepID=A0A016VRW0_9BILA|nr:hypothetical protein Y032_0005g2267 [Ancylostoma ceylanicum]
MIGQLFLFVLFLQFSYLRALSAPCRELLSCSIKKGCVNLPWLVSKMQNAEISEQMYNNIDAATDYACIFSSGCPRECTACSLCHNSKLQLVEVLTGSKLKDDVQCHELINCATKCVSKSGSDLSAINHCLRHMCAYHCFNGSCPKCAAFITKVFNQMCISGDFRGRVKGFKVSSRMGNIAFSSEIIQQILRVNALNFSVKSCEQSSESSSMIKNELVVDD